MPGKRFGRRSHAGLAFNVETVAEGVAVLVPKDLYEHVRMTREITAQKVGLDPADLKSFFAKAYERAEALFHRNGGTDVVQA